MEMYLFTLAVLFLFSFFEIRCVLTEKQLLCFKLVVFILLVFQVGLRWETGTDWPYYTNNFEDTNNVADVFLHIIMGFEPGYGFSVLFIKKIYDSYSFFLVVHALVYYYLIFIAFKRLTPYFFISLLLFYVTTLGLWGSNRQLIALAICLNALTYVFEKKSIKFGLSIALAFLFHSTALVFCVYYFMNREIKAKMVVLVLLLAFIIGKTNLPTVIFSFAGNLIGGGAVSKVGAYTESAMKELEEAPLSLLGLIRRLIYLVLFLLNYNFLKTKLKYYALLFNGYLFGLVLYFLFSSTLLIIVNRGSLYFNVMESFLLASQFMIIKSELERCYVLAVLFVVSIFLMFQSITAYPDLFLPYKGVFINADYSRLMH